jgi:hypothetical protein
MSKGLREGGYNLPAMRDPFAVLGLPPTASAEEIKARYRQLARQHHPDAGPTGSSARMAEINRAYDELMRDLDGCRRAAKRTDSPPRSQRAQRERRRGPVRSTRPENRASQWKEWLARTRRAAAGPRRQPTYSTRGAAPIRVSPQVLTVCRHHGPADLRVSGPGAEQTTVLFSPSELDVTRGAAGSNEQQFRVRFARLPSWSEGTVQLRVRSGEATRTVPVYEFSCPSAEGSCAFAS